MNVKPLLKYFPEIHHLPPERQLALVSSAHQAAFGPEQKLRVWRNNLVSCAILIGLALLLISGIGPLFNFSAGVTAIFMILVVLPGFFFIQHKRYINELRPRVLELAAQASLQT